MKTSEILNCRIPSIVAKITETIRSREDKKAQWASFKRENNDYLNDSILLPANANVKAGELMGFDIDSENSSIPCRCDHLIVD